MKEAGVLLKVVREALFLAGGYLAQHAFDGAGRVGDLAACVGRWPCGKSTDAESQVSGGGGLFVAFQCNDSSLYSALKCFIAPREDFSLHKLPANASPHKIGINLPLKSSCARPPSTGIPPWCLS